MSKPRWSLYHEMLAHPDSPIGYAWNDTLVTWSKVRPTREELIEGSMSIPTFTFSRKTNGDPGYEMVSGPTYWTREKAELAAEGWAVREPEQKENKAA